MFFSGVMSEDIDFQRISGIADPSFAEEPHDGESYIAELMEIRGQEISAKKLMDFIYSRNKPRLCDKDIDSLIGWLSDQQLKIVTSPLSLRNANDNLKLHLGREACKRQAADEKPANDRTFLDLVENIFRSGDLFKECFYNGK